MEVLPVTSENSTNDEVRISEDLLVRPAVQSTGLPAGHTPAASRAVETVNSPLSVEIDCIASMQRVLLCIA